MLCIDWNAEPWKIERLRIFNGLIVVWFTTMENRIRKIDWIFRAYWINLGSRKKKFYKTGICRCVLLCHMFELHNGRRTEGRYSREAVMKFQRFFLLEWIWSNAQQWGSNLTGQDKIPFLSVVKCIISFATEPIRLALLLRRNHSFFSYSFDFSPTKRPTPEYSRLYSNVHKIKSVWNCQRAAMCSLPIIFRDWMPGWYVLTASTAWFVLCVFTFNLQKKTENISPASRIPENNCSIQSYAEAAIDREEKIGIFSNQKSRLRCTIKTWVLYVERK